MPAQRDWLIWDGECGFCYRTVRWLKKRDQLNRFQVSAFQNTPSPPMNDGLRSRAVTEVIVVRATGETLGGAAAVMYVLSHTGWGWFARLLAYPPFIWVLNVGYRLVAKNRNTVSKALFGEASCGLDFRYPEPED